MFLVFHKLPVKKKNYYVISYGNDYVIILFCCITRNYLLNDYDERFSDILLGDMVFPNNIVFSIGDNVAVPGISIKSDSRIYLRSDFRFLEST